MPKELLAVFHSPMMGSSTPVAHMQVMASRGAKQRLEHGGSAAQNVQQELMLPSGTTVIHVPKLCHPRLLSWTTATANGSVNH